jgi:hypothetical protein
MSSVEQPQVEAKSSIKVLRNAKGDPQFEIKVVEGVDEDELIRLQTLAVDRFWSLSRDLAGSI